MGVAAGLATAAHGLADTVGLDELADRYRTADAATRAAVSVSHVTPSAVDSRALATFAAAGVVALVPGGLASLALGPAWWVGVALLLREPGARVETVAQP